MEGTTESKPETFVSEIGDLSTTLKDTFWKDLEEGKVNLFATDMYSRVKGGGRSCATKNDNEQNSGNEEEPKRKSLSKKSQRSSSKRSHHAKNRDRDRDKKKRRRHHKKSHSNPDDIIMFTSSDSDSDRENISSGSLSNICHQSDEDTDVEFCSSIADSINNSITVRILLKDYMFKEIT